jgi:ATP-dependent exoDNAse (exonuclease V) beta subunit
VDFKTAPEGADPAALERSYAGQLGVYAEGLRRALDLEGPPPAAIHVL